MKTTTDENGHSWKEYTSPQGWTTTTIDPLKHTTTFQYDALGQLTASTDPDTMTTTYKYDGFGHQIERVHPDAGTTKWIYDNAGNLIATQTQRQINDKTQTSYIYDYNRLIRTEYPQHPQLNVHYRYDSVGRLAERTDLTGSIAYQYDEFGNIKQEDRKIILPNEEKIYNFVTKYDYDLLGRMRQIVYPDSEEVQYHYQLGQLTTIQAGEQNLAKGMEYDENDRMTAMQYGNELWDYKGYDADRQWLNWQVLSSDRLYMSNEYSYDKVGNILRVPQTLQVTSSDGAKWEQKAQTYKYDVANRLIESKGVTYEAKLLPKTSYDYSIAYSLSGMITNKTTMLDKVKNALKYGYATGYAGASLATDAVRNHQIRTIFDGTDTTRLTWDADGQLSTMHRVNKDGEVRGSRTHLWNENGQMTMFMDDKAAGYYGYDGNGERVYKLTGYIYDYDYNAGQDSTRVYFNDAVLYVNPYFIVTPKGYTKHYYNGTQRLASVVGDLNNLPDSIAKEGEVSRAKGYMHNFADNDTLVNLQVDYEKDMLLPVLSKEVPPSKGDEGGFYDLKANTYYYHGDHLGSMSWITDGYGEIIEHRSYLPYGETWYEKNFVQDRYTERFRFTGKERDEESGYDYFGARYYDPTLLTSWLSVDMLSDVDAERTPYGYCRQNPIMLYDPDGNFPHVVVGAAIGAAIGAGFALYEGKSWSEVGAAAAGGAVMGAITAATGGLASGVLTSAGLGAIGGAVGGAVGSLTEQGLNVAVGNQNNINADDVASAAKYGALFEGVGSVGSTVVKKTFSSLSKQIEAKYQSKTYQNFVEKQVKQDLQQGGKKASQSAIKKETMGRLADFKKLDLRLNEGTSEAVRSGVIPVITNTLENETNK